MLLHCALAALDFIKVPSIYGLLYGTMTKSVCEMNPITDKTTIRGNARR